ncbi:hypothetical protein [Streptomyces rimosus]|uniref:hypothetical protein n=1 Tax=Streptomyces rimosus TaxID=1927 RepID=UPI001F30F816|nr:hypothetical protein [Streptomyces rimosus]
MRNARTRSGARLVPWGGWAALAGGAVLCAVGWYGVSGERFAERQIPFLASCSIPGAALIVAGAVLVARGDQGLAAARVEELYGLLVAYGADGTPPGAHGPAAAREAVPDDTGPPLAVPGGTLLHRPGCPLVAGRPDARPVGEPPEAGPAATLTSCPVCEPGGARR